MSFHDIRLPPDVERGAVGGPNFKTTVLSLQSGYEKRNIDWSVARGEWDVGYGLMLKYQAGGFTTDIEELQSFFYARQGKAYSFRFKDWADYEIGANVTGGQAIGLGDDVTTQFQIYKRYTSGSIDYDRVVNKIVDTTVEVYLDGVLQTVTTDYTVDLTTGIVTMVVPPASTGGTGGGGEELLSIVCEFDNHVRFDTDKLNINMELFNVGSWPNIPIVELRGTGV